MKYWIIGWFALFVVLVGVFGHLKNETCAARPDGCEGEGYRCVNGRCRCAPGYVSTHPHDTLCVKCPGYGQACWGYCCSSRQDSLQCWQGTCQNCYDRYDNWICGDQINSRVLISATQIAMGTALVLGILATFVLLYKLCATPDVRTLGTQAYGGGRLSVGSMQLYVEERLRDPPPRYTRQNSNAAPPVYPLRGYLNAGFMHDSSVPPPPYSAPVKDEDTTPATNSHSSSTLHM